MRSAILVAFTLVLGACATNPGPTNSPEFGSLVAAALPSADGDSIEVYGPGTWTPNSRRMIELQNNGNILPDFAPWKDGVTIVSQSGLSFAEWDEEGRVYIVTKRIPRSNIAVVSLDKVGRSCALVVQEAQDSTFHVFEFVRGISNDCATARAAAAALQQTRE